MRYSNEMKRSFLSRCKWILLFIIINFVVWMDVTEFSMVVTANSCFQNTKSFRTSSLLQHNLLSQRCSTNHYPPHGSINRNWWQRVDHAEILSCTTVALLAQAKISEAEAKKGIDRVVAVLRNDPRAQAELGKLQRVTAILGYGTPQPDRIAVRFNASFQKSGKGLSSIPLPFGLGQSDVREGRGTMVGQVKASLNSKTGKLVTCSVFRDLGYGRTFELKV
jgi:hypothetical protein